MAKGQLVRLHCLTMAWVWKVTHGLARIVAVAHSNARNFLWCSDGIEIDKYPSVSVPVCEDYKRIAGSSPIFEKLGYRSKFLFFCSGCLGFKVSEGWFGAIVFLQVLFLFPNESIRFYWICFVFLIWWV
jgi:hypothetical protein